MYNYFISIIIPVYNWEKYIFQCINSIINQNYKNFEIIVVNDWSTDNTLNILDNFKNSSVKINVFSHKNHGVWYSRNIWLKHAKWEYVTFVDSDDFLEKDYLENFMNWVNRGYDIIIWWYIKYDWLNNKKIYVKKNNIWKYLNAWPRWKFFNRSFLLSNNISFPDRPPGEDVYFCISAYNKTKKISVIKYTWYYYNITNQNSIMHTSKNFDLAYIDRLSSVKQISPIDVINKKLIDYSLIRSSVFYLLFCWKSAKSKDFIAAYDKIFWRLKKNIPNYRKNIYLYKAVEPSFLYQWSIRFFLLIDKFWLVKLFSKMYCKK